MASPAYSLDLSKHCPHLACGEPLDAGASNACPSCGSGYKVCRNCRATNRLMVSFCRGCGQGLTSDLWPMYPGLSAESRKRPFVGSFGQPREIANLGANVAASALACDGVVIIPQEDGHIVFVDARDGKKLRQFSAGGGRITATPALSGGTLFVAAGPKLHAFDLLDALDQPAGQGVKPLWSIDSYGEEVIHPLLVDEQNVYLVTRRGDHVAVEAVRQSDRSPVWPEPFVYRTHETLPLAMLRDQLVLAGINGEVNFISASTGAAGDPIHVDKRIRRLESQVSPCVLGDRLLVADEDGRLFELGYGPRGASSHSLFDLRARITGLAAAGDYIVLGQLDGLTMLTSHGQKRWSYSDSVSGVYVPPIFTGASCFVVDEDGFGLLFHSNASPEVREKMLVGEVDIFNPPLMTGSRLLVVSYDGRVAAADWS